VFWPELPPDTSPSIYYACVSISVLVTGISKAGFGGGIGIVAMPVMSLVMPPQHMLGLTLPLLIAADALSNLHHLRVWETRLLKPLLLGAAVGVALGSLAFWLLERGDPKTAQRTVSGLVGGICLVFVVVQLLGLAGRRVPTLPPGTASSVGVGALAGFVSTLSHAAGPLVTLYLLQEKVEKRKLVGTLVFFFLLVNLSKVPTFVALDLINARTLRDSIWFIPLIPAGTLLGAWMNRRVPEKPFAAVLYVAAAITAGHMLWTALR
jgi:hypothetical protein